MKLQEPRRENCTVSFCFQFVCLIILERRGGEHGSSIEDHKDYGMGKSYYYYYYYYFVQIK